MQERDIFACGLHPLGFGFGEPLPDGVRDYAIEVRGHPGIRRCSARARLRPPGWNAERTLSAGRAGVGSPAPARRRPFGPAIRGPPAGRGGHRPGSPVDQRSWSSAETRTSLSGSPALST